MASNDVVRARIDKETKKEAAAVLASIGLTVSDAFRLMLVRVAKEKALPFDPLIPNQETIDAMREAQDKSLESFDSVDAVMEDLFKGDLADEKQSNKNDQEVSS